MTAGRDGSVNLHATCIVLGEAGILIRGASGSGKSTLARHLLERGDAEGIFARLVCDDRVLVSRHHSRLVARALPSIAGQLEIRGLGLVALPFEPAAILRLVVDYDATPARLPADDDLETRILGVALPQVAIAGHHDPVGITLWRWRDVCDTLLTVP